MSLSELNELPVLQLKEALTTCCGSTTWVNEMATVFPVESEEHLFEQAETIWFACSENDWLEAFEHHPKIGDISSLREKFANTKAWASGEQSGVTAASPDTLKKLADGNRLYEEKFGYIFIVFASGKSADEMLDILESRLPNPPEEEILIAMQEQNKITRTRLEKLLRRQSDRFMSRITTHILDTSRGKPAEGVAVTLYRQQRTGWAELAQGTTDSDGRISDLFTEAIPTGPYKLRFETQAYFDKLSTATFYPFVEIVFSVITGEHYHVPLLLNPFGYSTYRGS